MQFGASSVIHFSVTRNATETFDYLDVKTTKMIPNSVLTVAKQDLDVISIK